MKNFAREVFTLEEIKRFQMNMELCIIDAAWFRPRFNDGASGVEAWDVGVANGKEVHGNEFPVHWVDGRRMHL